MHPRGKYTETEWDSCADVFRNARDDPFHWTYNEPDNVKKRFTGEVVRREVEKDRRFFVWRDVEDMV
jgi:hypothetical protein